MATSNSRLTVDIVGVQKFLELRGQVDGLKELSGGSSSVSYYYREDGEQLIIRISPWKEHFLCAQYIGKEYGGLVGMQKIIDVGEYEDGSYFSISNFVEGMPMATSDQFNYDEKETENMASSFSETLVTISRTKAVGSGYGRISNNGIGGHRSWKEYLKETEMRKHPKKYSRYVLGRRLDEGLFNEAQAALDKLAEDSYETRHLVHGDFQPYNIIIKDGQVVAVLDWAMVLWGDFTFDIAWAVMHAPIVANEQRLLAEYSSKNMNMENIKKRLLASKLRVLTYWAFQSVAHGNYDWVANDQKMMADLLK